MCKSKFFPASLKFHTKASEEQEELFRRIMSFLPQSPMRSGVPGSYYYCRCVSGLPCNVLRRRLFVIFAVCMYGFRTTAVL